MKTKSGSSATWSNLKNKELEVMQSIVQFSQKQFVFNSDRHAHTIKLSIMNETQNLKWPLFLGATRLQSFDKYNSNDVLTFWKITGTPFRNNANGHKWNKTVGFMNLNPDSFLKRRLQVAKIYKFGTSV